VCVCVCVCVCDNYERIVENDGVLWRMMRAEQRNIKN
jgi:hypothetical protein